MFRNRLISEAHFDGQTVPGDLGVEVEVEGRNLPTEGRLLREWRIEGDGSLRGNSAEYVFRQPLSAEQGMKAIDDLYSAFDRAGTDWEDTTRAGIHVHVNVRHLTEGQVLSFALLFIVFEEALARFCGEEREGNLFCMRAQDAEYLLYALRKASCHPYGWRNMTSDRVRYAAVNPTSVLRYGSLEFRGMKSPVPKSVLKEWCAILLRLREASLQYDTPLQIIAGVSEAVGGDFARDILGPEWAERLEPPAGWEEVVKKGMRNVQPVARTFENAVDKAREAGEYNPQPWQDQYAEAPGMRAGEELRGVAVGRNRMAHFDDLVAPAPPEPPEEVEELEDEDRRVHEEEMDRRAQRHRRDLNAALERHLEAIAARQRRARVRRGE